MSYAAPATGHDGPGMGTKARRSCCWLVSWPTARRAWPDDDGCWLGTVTTRRNRASPRPKPGSSLRCHREDNEIFA